ncbi:MAG: 3-isopropylmalate dehydrogenase [Candidatus Latescibacteria bacterium]|nr:3-isopropylmalate dehydrogenase [Candidatus Latescibacterota bacterium]
MKTYKIALLAGDGIGPEITREAVKVLDAVQAQSNARFECISAPFGGVAYQQTGKSFPAETKQICDQADAILKGPIGLSKEESEQIPIEERPERGAILPLRRRYDTFANYRPVYLPATRAHFSPLKPEVVGDGIDILMIRELVGGLYFGHKERGTDDQGQRFVHERLEYDEGQIRRIMRVAFTEAQKRKGVLHNIHKSNVLMSSVLWNEILEEVAVDFADVTVEHVLVDAAATLLCLQPQQYDVMVMENLFGDILSDQGGGLVGSLGLMPSACIGPEKAYYEPAHGSAPDIAGQGIANPYSMIGSVAMMLEHSFAMENEARAVWAAVEQVFADGYVTPDLAGQSSDLQILGTEAFGDKVVESLRLDA